MRYREILDVAIGDSPPTAVDLDQVIRRQRRVVRVRRAGAYGTAAGLVLAVTLGAGLAVDRSSRPATTPVAANSGTPTPWPTVQQVAGTEAAERFKARVVAAFVAQVPGLRWASATSSRPGVFPTAPTSGAPVSLARQDFRDAGFVFDAYAVDGTVSNEFYILALRKPQPDKIRNVLSCTSQDWDACRLSDGPAGARVREGMTIRYWGNGRADDYRRVDVLFVDGSWIQIRLYSGDRRFLLTTDQLRELALDPAVRPF